MSNSLGRLITAATHWPLDRRRTFEPFGHRFSTEPRPPSPPRIYPHCDKCGAWVLSRICEFCGKSLKE